MLTGNADGAHEFRNLSDMVDVRTLTEPQEVFDHVARHLLTQGTAALMLAGAEEDGTRDEICAYRGEGGCSCAVGILIHDSEYDESYEGGGLSSLLRMAKDTPLAERLTPNYNLLSLLQGIHDRTLRREGIEATKIELRALAIQSGLKIPHELVDVTTLTEAQDIFDYVAEHLIRQGRAAMMPSKLSLRETICAYRSEDGCSCAVGCLIADDEYSPNMERMGIESLVHVFEGSPAIQRFLPNKTLLSRLQGVHDSFLKALGIEATKKELARVAEEFGLEVRFDTAIDVRNLTKPQEIFDYVANHLITQGTASMRESNLTCAYRGMNGTSCAVGCLMHETEYRKAFEGASLQGLLGYHPSMDPALHKRLDDNRILLSDLQRVHDQQLQEEGLEAAKQRLRFVADTHDLIVNFN